MDGSTKPVYNGNDFAGLWCSPGVTMKVKE
jgi:hypothetical protein